MKIKFLTFLSLLIAASCTGVGGATGGSLENHQLACEYDSEGDAVCKGTIETIIGTEQLKFSPGFSGDVDYNLSVSVEEGDLDLWLVGSDGERNVARASLVMPGVLNGTTTTNRSPEGNSEFVLFFGAVGQRVSGIEYTLSFAKP
jgi:hypothetical protein